jgi:hypothetical protein
MSSCTPMWMWVYSRGLRFTYRPSSGGFNFSVDGWSTYGCLAVFSRLQGKTNSFLLFLSDYWVALIINRCGVRLFLVGWNGFINCCFCFSQSGLMLTCRTTANQACFCISQLSLCVSTIKFRNIWNWNIWRLEAKWNLNIFFHQEGLAATPALPGVCLILFLDIYSSRTALLLDVSKLKLIFYA